MRSPRHGKRGHGEQEPQHGWLTSLSAKGGDSEGGALNGADVAPGPPDPTITGVHSPGLHGVSVRAGEQSDASAARAQASLQGEQSGAKWHEGEADIVAGRRIEPSAKAREHGASTAVRGSVSGQSPQSQGEVETLRRVVTASVHGAAEGLATRVAANAAEEPRFQPGQVPDLNENCG